MRIYPLIAGGKAKIQPVEFIIHNEGNGDWRVEGDKVERLFYNTNFDDEDAVLRFGHALSKMHLDEELRKAGCQNGDFVYIKDYSFEFKDE